MKKILLGVALVSAGIFTSCSDYLNEEPKLKQSNELTFSTYSNLNSAGAALYGMMQSSSWYDGEFVLESEMRAGNAKNPTSLAGSGRYRDDTQWNYTSSSTSPLWAYAYYTIARANNVINNLDGKVSSEVSQQDVDNLKAEALFMRALSHFDLVITYAQPYNNTTDTLGVPVVLTTQNGKPARNSVKAVYRQVVKDLTQAESLMSDSYSRSGALDAAAVVSKEAIQALLSRVYLYMGSWQNAADYASKVINSGKYALASGDDYVSMFTAATAPKGGEIIFEVYGSDKNEYWDESGWTHLSYITSIDGYGDVCATSDLVNLYETGDIRLNLFKKNENDNFSLKYYGKTGAAPRQTNIPIIRLSEMYLNRAEAIINGASVTGITAAKDLNTLAEKRGATASAATKTGVFTDRRKELAFEGHIVYDYARTNTSLVRTDFDEVSNKDVSYPSFRWAMPIPKREMDANPNMVQNPGY
jgi:starch-binding outer membrane protein, SusD/RagB family